jgi:large subunit ribosomal protein L5
MSRLRKLYREKVAQQLRTDRNYKNIMQVPRLTKVVVNMGFNSQTDKDTIKAMAEDMATITGQKPVMNKSKKSIANFHLREGMVIGCKVTLRGSRMFEFMDRLIVAALPRIRDFRGVSKKAFDGRGNYTLGLQDQGIFPEMDPDKIKKHQGMDITFVTTAKTNDEARDLLRALGMPFEN